MIDHMKLTGSWGSKRVWLDGKELFPGRSQKLCNHSPDGFNWGYGGSGPSQFALALLLELSKDEKFALKYYHQFAWQFVTAFPVRNFEFDAMIMMDWIEARKKGL